MGEKPRHGPWKAVFGGVVLGAVLLAASAAAMHYTDSRPFCGGCHVMNEAALTHSQSPHADLACNECHAPHSLPAKLPFKAAEGLRDVISNLGGGEPAAQARLETRDVVNANCRSCHRVTVSEVMTVKPYCVDCHSGMAHQKKKPVSFREAADE